MFSFFRRSLLAAWHANATKTVNLAYFAGEMAYRSRLRVGSTECAGLPATALRIYTSYPIDAFSHVQ